MATSRRKASKDVGKSGRRPKGSIARALSNIASCRDEAKEAWEGWRRLGRQASEGWLVRDVACAVLAKP